jgi:hypothetical protein
MKRYAGGGSALTPEQFDTAFDSFVESAFRLQAQPQYLVPDEEEEFRLFREGRPLPEWSVRTSTWLRRVAESTAAGKRWQRVQLIDGPLNDYLRFELDSYDRGNIDAGEDIRIAQRNAAPQLARAQRDFWLFDEGLSGAAVVFTDYNPDGHILGFERTTDPAVLSECTRTRRIALAHAVPSASTYPLCTPDHRLH